MSSPHTVKKFSLQGFDAEQFQRTEAYVKAIDNIFNSAIQDFIRLVLRNKIDTNKPFDLNDYPSAKRAIRKVLNDLASKMQAVTEEGSRQAWLYASEKSDAFLNAILNTSKVKKELLAAMQDKNLDALQAFQGRKINGMDLSDRVWNYVDQFQSNMELSIDVGIGEGKSAQELSQDVRSMLNNPDNLFRRVRDKWGNLVLSQRAKDFHPGQGVYRSSYKNAMRLTRSEINMSYREADYLRWQQLDFVTGVMVKVSNNHPIADICDELQGKYPKDFKWTGWHTQCRCYATPILMSQEDFNTDELNELKSAINDTEYSKFASSNTVNDVPGNFKQWISDNAERSQNWKSVPYFIKDNFKGGKISGGLKYKKE